MGKSEETRRHIIEKAAALFNQKGFHGTSISDIMEATGLTKGGIYGNFKKEGADKKGVKEEIAVASFLFAVQAVAEEIRGRTSVIENSIDKLKTVVYYYKERVLHPKIEGGCPILNTSIEADDNMPLLRSKVVEAIKHWHYGITRTIEKGQEQGEIKKDIDPPLFASRFIGTLEGGIMLSRIHRDVNAFSPMASQLLEMIEAARA